MNFLIATTIFLSAARGLEAHSIRQAASGAATVDLSKSTGPAKFSASGWIYGFPDNGSEADKSIPEELIRNVNFIASRAGGAQTPTRGWVGGYNSYVGRLQSTVSNYRTTRKYGGEFILLVHDLWGADGSSIPLFPGDSGNWTSTDNFLRQLASDIRKYSMLDGLVLDIWNEPDLSIFWNRSWNQFLQYYIHAHKFLKQEFPSTKISGPSMAHAPTLSDTNWQTWFATIASNHTIPDIYSWHQIGSWSRQPDTTVPDFNKMKSAQNLPDLPIDLNEYASKDEQNPGTTVYYIAQLERHNLRGLRANWGSGSKLHDTLANLVGKNADGTYYANGEWQLYKYYASMKGDRLATTASPDRLFDVFATKSGSTIKVIAGTRNKQASYDIKISGLSTLGISGSGSIKIRTYQFDWAGDSGKVGPPKDLGLSNIAYASGLATIRVNPVTNTTAYAYEIIGA